MDCDWVPVLRFRLCIAAVQGQPWRGPRCEGIALGAGGLSFHPMSFHQVSLYVTCNERGPVDRMSARLVRVNVV